MFGKKRVSTPGVTGARIDSRMDEYFKMAAEETVMVDSVRLRALVQGFFTAYGVPDHEAEQGADVLLYADLRGITTHGVSLVLKGYLEALASKKVNPRPNVRCLAERPATALLDGDAGLGVVTAPMAMQLAVKKAAQCGIGVVTMRNSRHLGAAGYHAGLAARHNMVGLCMTAAGGNSMVPTLGAEPLIGTNAIAVAAPGAQMPMFVFDAATTAVAGTKLKIARLIKKSLLAGWVSDRDGRPRMFPSEPYGQNERRMMLPLGSTNELSSYKGFGLGMVVEILAGQLSFAEGFADLRSSRLAHFFAALNIEAFGDVDEFKAHMDSMLAKICASKPMHPEGRVWYAGLRQSENERERRTHGIPLHTTVVGWLKETASGLGIPFDLA
jgi:L-2-hydroxycarboxylate dehydrogenase (NAD+)